MIRVFRELVRAQARDILRQMKSDVADYCQLEGNETDTDIATSTGGIVSYLHIAGALQTVSKRRFDSFMSDVESSLVGTLVNPGMRLDVVFSRDPTASRDAPRGALQASYATGRRLGLNVEALLDERADVVARHTAPEHCLAALSTYPTSLPPANVKIARKKQSATARRLKVPLSFGRYSQRCEWSIPELRARHAATLQLLSSAFSQFCPLHVVDVRSAMRSLRDMISPGSGRDWTPSLIGDGSQPLRLAPEIDVTHDYSHLWPLPLPHQLFRSAPRGRGRFVHHEGRCYVTLLMEVPPHRVETFSSLFASVPPDTPWRVAITISTGHQEVLRKVTAKGAMATLAAWTGSENKLIAAAAEQLKAEAHSGETLAALSISACTWGADEDEATSRAALLARSLEAWGNTSVHEDRGDPVESWLATLPGFARQPVAPPCAYRLGDALRMLPLTRPHSPWQDGSVLFRTADGTLFPMLPGSSLQRSVVDLIFARQRSGKSVKLAADNLGLILSPDIELLPRIAIIDIGPSSFFWVEFVRTLLPRHLRHQARGVRLRLDAATHAINPFDLPLGCRRPFAATRSFLIHLLSLLLTPAGAPPIQRLNEFCGQLVDTTYDYYAPGQQPLLYEVGCDESVDRGVEVHCPGLTRKTSWWDVVDALFDAGEAELAGRAQRFAVPTLNEVSTAIATDVALRDAFAKATVADSSEPMIDFVNSMLTTVIRDYPLLAQPSVFDVGGARIVSIDLAEVVSAGRSAQGEKQTALFYLLARQLLCADYYSGREVLAEVPERYRDFHRKRIEADEGRPKKICYDEFHRTAAAPQVRDQVLRDIREGGKYNVRIALLSQLLEDFDSEMIELATNSYLLSRAVGKDGSDTITGAFDPTTDAMDAMRRHVTGPSAAGAPMLYLGMLDGVPTRVEQVLYLTLGPMELWAYSSTPEDALIRSRLVTRMGLYPALQLLAQRFPGGSAKPSIEAMGKQLGDDAFDYEAFVERLVAENRAA